jgi:hypothetical protein
MKVDMSVSARTSARVLANRGAVGGLMTTAMGLDSSIWRLRSSAARAARSAAFWAEMSR